MTPPDRQTTAGRAFLDLRHLAQTTGRATDELLQIYALEGFLDRLTQSDQRDHFVLKGGVLLAAYEARRATRDIDFAARQIANDIETMLDAVRTIFAVQIDDGLTYNPEFLRAQIIREDDDYSGVRITATAQLATARLHFHLDINVGDPIWPEPTVVALPRLLGSQPIRIVGYPIAMILAEKIVTALQRGTANTRWRDFVDINNLITTNPPDPDELRTAIQRVAEHRQATIRPLAETLANYATIAQPRWTAGGATNDSKQQPPPTSPTSSKRSSPTSTPSSSDPRRPTRPGTPNDHFIRALSDTVLTR